LNGGDFEEGVLNPASYRYTEAVVLSQPAIRSDYEFKGWYDNAALKGEPVTNISTRSTGDKTFWAQWVRQYTITFETHGGSPVNPITQDENTTVNEPAEPAKDGFRFLGWFSQADGGTEYDDWPYTLTGNVTMHAQWKPPASILITLHPSSKPSIISTKTEISINQGATFTIETGSTDIAWHWNGERIPEQTAASYTLEPYSIRRPGIYELSVVVTEGGEKLSAWCRVIIMAEGGR
jgi:uncharacterized repeat protein (TIGR02543 family)